MSHNSNLIFTGERLKNIYTWEDEVSYVDYATENIYINPNVSPMPGYMSFESNPYLKEILKDRDKQHVYKQMAFASTQVGKTTALLVPASKDLDKDPSIGIFITPNEKGVPNYVDTKVDPFLAGIKSLNFKIEDFEDVEKVRSKLARKQVGGGMLLFLGNTASNRSSYTAKYLYMDEIRLFKKGHVKELVGRTKAYERYFRKIIAASSWESEGDEAQLFYESCDCKKELQIECPECGDEFFPTRNHFKYLGKEAYATKHKMSIEDIEHKEYKHEALQDVRVECECGCKINSQRRDELVKSGHIKMVIVEGNDETMTSIGYKGNALCTVITQYETIAEELIDSKDDPILLHRIYRDYFHELFKPNSKAIEQESLWLLKSGYPELQVPDDTFCLTMSVDNQKNSVYVTLIAHTYNKNRYVILRQQVQANDGDDWETCETLFGSMYSDREGKKFKVSALGVDFRGYSDIVTDVSRIDEAKAFVKNMLVKINKSGYNNQKVFGIYGVDTKETKGTLLFEGMKLPRINMNNLGTKHALYQDAEVDGFKVQGCIPRTIDHIRDKQGAYEPHYDEDKPRLYNSNLFFIADDIIEHEENVKEHYGKLGKNEFTNHLNAEKYDPTLNMYVRKSKRNDYSDCVCMGEKLAGECGINTAERPKPTMSSQEAMDVMFDD